MSSKSPGPEKPAVKKRKAPAVTAASTSNIYSNANTSNLSFDSALLRTQTGSSSEIRRPASVASEAASTSKPKKEKVKKTKKSGIDAQVKDAVANVGLVPPSAPRVTTTASSGSIPKARSHARTIASRPNTSTVSLPLAAAAPSASPLSRSQLDSRSRSSNNLRQATSVPLGEQPLLIAQPTTSSAVASTSSLPLATQETVLAVPKKKKRKKLKTEAQSSAPAQDVATEPSSIQAPPASIVPRSSGQTIEEPTSDQNEAQAITISNIDNAEEEAQAVAVQEYQAAMRRRDVYEGMHSLETIMRRLKQWFRARHGNE